MNANRLTALRALLQQKGLDAVVVTKYVNLHYFSGFRGDDTTLVVTLEPCVMCAGAILAARIPRVVFGAWDEKAGAAGSMHDLLRDRRLPHRAEVVGGLRAEEAAARLTSFFEARRRP